MKQKKRGEMLRNRLITFVSLIVALGCWITALVIAATAVSEQPMTRRLSRDEAEKIGRALAEKEPLMRDNARRRFAGDRWSADDDFHNAEQRFARRIAMEKGVSAGDVLRIIDDDIHRNAGEQPSRITGAAPCKPRPFYD